MCSTCFFGVPTLMSSSKYANGDISCPSPPLAPGASETCTGTYTVTQADVDAGSVTDTATAQATPSLGRSVDSGSSDTVSATYATSSLSLVDASTTSSYGGAGDSIDYDYAVRKGGVGGHG
jgi:large repetitive protein